MLVSKIEAYVLEDGGQKEWSETILWWRDFPKNSPTHENRVSDSFPWPDSAIWGTTSCSPFVHTFLSCQNPLKAHMWQKTKTGWGGVWWNSLLNPKLGLLLAFLLVPKMPVVVGAACSHGPLRSVAPRQAWLSIPGGPWFNREFYPTHPTQTILFGPNGNWGVLTRQKCARTWCAAFCPPYRGIWSREIVGNSIFSISCFFGKSLHHGMVSDHSFCAGPREQKLLFSMLTFSSNHLNNTTTMKTPPPPHPTPPHLLRIPISQHYEPFQTTMDPSW